MATFQPVSGTVIEGRRRVSIQASSTEKITQVLLALKITETAETVREFNLSSNINTNQNGNSFNFRFSASSGLTLVFSVTIDGGSNLTIEYDVAKRRIV